MKKNPVPILQPFIKFFKRVFRRIRQDKKVFITFVVFELICAGVLIRNAFTDRIDSAVIAALAMILLFVPSVVENGFHLRLPLTLEIIVFGFVFAAEILGEIGDFYQNVPLWDTALHTMSGFMFAAFGFCVVDIFNQSGRFKAQLTPFFLTFVAFCFSITIGTLWEFFEFGGDSVFGLDMQKDFFINTINSVSLHGAGDPETVTLNGITKTVIYYASSDGEPFVIEHGYLDIGLIDTMKDMLVNFIGAVIFCIVGYIYIKHRDSKNKAAENMARVAKNMIPEYIGGYGKYIANAEYIEGDEEDFAEAEAINNPPKKPGIFSPKRKHEKLKNLSPVGALLADNIDDADKNPDNPDKNESEFELEKSKRKSLFKKKKSIQKEGKETPIEALLEASEQEETEPKEASLSEAPAEEIIKQNETSNIEETPIVVEETTTKEESKKSEASASQVVLELNEETPIKEAPISEAPTEEKPKPKRTRKKKAVEPIENTENTEEQ